MISFFSLTDVLVATIVVCGILCVGVGLFLLARFGRRPAAHAAVSAPRHSTEATAAVASSSESSSVAVTA